MIRAIYTKNGDSFLETNIDNIHTVLEQKPKLLWLDIAMDNQGLSGDEIGLLTDTFKFHELSVEDCVFPQYHPKVEEFENYVFVAVHGVRAKEKTLSDIEDSIYELDLFISKEFVVSVHSGELLIVDTLFERAKLKPQIELRTLENLLYNIFQKVVSSFEFTMDKVNERFDEIEDEVLKNPSAELMSEIFSLKKILLNLRKITEPQQNVYTYFSRETTGIISKKFTAYFRDVFFQLDRINQSISSHNQIVGSILEVYVSGITLKLNEVMKFLTIIATIFLPALLIVSYYGMNVNFPEHRLIGPQYLWYFVVSIIAAATIGTYFYMRKKKWF